MAGSKNKVQIGIDSGGTFTDVVVAAGDKLHHFKIPSNPADPAGPVLEGVRRVAGEFGEGLTVHGTTVGTNSVLERKGADTALLTTAGFEDILLIGRQTRPKLYQLVNPPIEPIIPPDRSFGVRERTTADGSIIESPNPEQLRELIPKLRALNVKAIAVCFLHSYANPANERAIASALRAAGFDVSCSSDILPEYREYERCSTVAINAFLRPVLSRYYERLEAALPRRGLRIMQSSGGCISSEAARERPVQTVLSGPAGGVVGAHALTSMAGYDKVITLDMGGTSTDVSIISGRIPLTAEGGIEGLPIRLPMVDIVTVGSGGGSLAWFDHGGALRVGPRSAGAFPGPVCYGTGENLTVTDAHLFLGSIPADKPLGGVLTLDPDRTARRFEHEAAKAGMTPHQLADGIITVAGATMERALRVVSVQRGHDPRDFALFAFGGAGGLHACSLADTLRISTVIIPDSAGTMSALGMLLADAVKDYSRTVFLRGAQMTYNRIERAFKPLESAAEKDLLAEGFKTADIELQRSVAMRYEGQSYELEIPLEPDLVDAFHAAHLKRYSHADPERGVEAVNIVLRAVGITAKPPIPEAPEREHQAQGPLTTIFIGGEKLQALLLKRSDLERGARFNGPAVVYDIDSTTLVQPGWHAALDRWRNLILKREA
jgi:N-methylhydantoinase A/oxoprolinase/acetone carboxylase beta subunit